MGRIHRYEGNDIIVEFDLGRCIHTGDCSRNLAAVFNVKRRGRWVSPDAAEAEAIARVCEQCPSGALRCIDKRSGKPMQSEPSENSVQTIADGPLYLHARMLLNGEPLNSYRAALCRCGTSRLMPYCDNSHRTSGFSDPGNCRPCTTEATAANDPKQPLAITALPDGPLIFKGPFKLLDAAGETVQHAQQATICRCGASQMKPCCDGSHFTIDFHCDG